ncbi:MAG: putative lipoprotein [Proteobacteria bacterium]|nr:putative lipoprotein [Pseudomonadota bacterium]
MFSKKYYIYIGLLTAVSLSQGGCSISYSLEKSSDSVSASLDSITSISNSSTSSSGGEKSEEQKVDETATAYEEDIAAVTVLYVSREKNNDEFQRKVASIAKNHGISDWEQENSTFLAMGKGLRRAGVAEESIGNLPYFRSIAGTSKYAEVLKGYNL